MPYAQAEAKAKAKAGSETKQVCQLTDDNTTCWY